MGKKGNYKARKPVDDQDRPRNTRKGFVAYFSKPEHAAQFQETFKKNNSPENVSAAFDEIQRINQELERIWEKSLID
jgi:hypothetical protein